MHSVTVTEPLLIEKGRESAVWKYLLKHRGLIQKCLQQSLHLPSDADAVSRLANEYAQRFSE
eukprot:2427514-Prymnesium_polylepis.1